MVLDDRWVGPSLMHVCRRQSSEIEGYMYHLTIPKVISASVTVLLWCLVVVALR